MVKFKKCIPFDGKSTYDILKNKSFRGTIRFFKDTNEWAVLHYPSGRIERFETLSEAKEEGLKV